MILTPEELWNYVNKVPGWFSRLNAEKLYEYALQSPGVVAEIGISSGRSATVLLLAARHTGARVILVDNWKEHFDTVDKLIDKNFYEVSSELHYLSSIDAAQKIDDTLSLIHIDANHCGEGPEQDCIAWLPKLSSGGIACFHDYGSNFDAVTQAVDKYTEGWGNLGDWESLAIRRKP
jgi:predicted O-methyltransferase YrrM